MRTLTRSLVLPAIVALVAACGGQTSPAPTHGGTNGPPAGTTSPSTPPAASDTAETCHEPAAGEATTVETTVGDFLWADVTAKVGDVITWTNTDTVPHAIETDDKTCRQDNQIPGNGTGSVVFDVAGTYPFICWVHPTMKGTITITES